MSMRYPGGYQPGTDPLDDGGGNAPPHDCDHGWKTVGAGYVNNLLDGAEVSERMREYIMTSTVYPCRVCRPNLFYRWVGGHLQPGHEHSECAECKDYRSGVKPRRRSGFRPAQPPPPPERRDVQ